VGGSNREVKTRGQKEGVNAEKWGDFVKGGVKNRENWPKRGKKRRVGTRKSQKWQNQGGKSRGFSHFHQNGVF